MNIDSLKLFQRVVEAKSIQRLLVEHIFLSPR